MENTQSAPDVDGSERPAELPAGLLARMKADPAQAPEYLAMAAVERFGPEANGWLQKHQGAPPGYTVAIIQTRFVRLSQASGAAAGLTGLPGAVIDVGVLAWNQARMVIYLAAAHGLDPTDSDRAAELLLLRGIQTKLDAARTAIAVARRKQDASALGKHLPAGMQAYTELAWQLARMAGLAAAKRMVLKLVPVLGAPFGALANGAATKKLAGAAISYYRDRRPPTLE
jgi:hypothetical protein